MTDKKWKFEGDVYGFNVNSVLDKFLKKEVVVIVQFLSIASLFYTCPLIGIGDINWLGLKLVKAPKKLNLKSIKFKAVPGYDTSG